MGKYDRLGESLKAIINGHNNIISEVKISDNNSMITMIINGINHKGINIMVDEQALLEDANMSDKIQALAICAFEQMLICLKWKYKE